MCYQLLKEVPKGKITTYKAVAEALNTRAYRAVGIAMKINKNSPKIPCHRVILSDGSLGGFTFQGKFNINKKIELLKSEGIIIKNKRINLDKYMHKFN